MVQLINVPVANATPPPRSCAQLLEIVQLVKVPPPSTPEPYHDEFSLIVQFVKVAPSQLVTPLWN